MRKWFGTDGIRGVANEQLTVDFVYKLGQASGIFYRSISDRPKLVVGKDTRLSGDMLEAALLSGLMSVGVDVIPVGIIPTPGVAYLTRKHGADGGVVISASHNPFQDNGIKFFGSTGFKLMDEQEETIESIILQDDAALASNENIGKVIEITETLSYAQYLSSLCPATLWGLHIAIDTANGASYKIAADLFRNLGAQVTEIHAEPNGVNINVDCGSTHPSSLQEVVVQKNADVGFAFDGDADRLIAVNEKGLLVDGDDLLFIYANEMKQQGKLNHNTVALTIMSNYGLLKALEEKGIGVALTAVGDRYIIESMRENGYNLGGEQSGHIIFSDLNTTGDGMLAAIQLAGIMAKSKKTLSQLASGYQKYPQYMKNVKVKNKAGWEQNETIRLVIEKAKEKLADEGRILVRASGTESLIRVMAEGPDEEALHKIVQDVSHVVEEQCS